MILSVKRARLEEDIHKLFARLQKRDFPDVVMKTILPPLQLRGGKRVTCKCTMCLKISIRCG